jgi:sugar/nucleoside kinase (ribokinase family)
MSRWLAALTANPTTADPTTANPITPNLSTADLAAAAEFAVQVAATVVTRFGARPV